MKGRIMEMVLKRQQQLRKQGKKGFTLVELIVVIVILGILLAIAVPALVGYIDKARNDAAFTEAATARTAIQTIVSDAYGHNGTYYSPDGTANNIPNVTAGTATADNMIREINRLTGATYNATGFTYTVSNGKLQTFKIKVPSGPTVSWDGAAYSIVNVAP